MRSESGFGLPDDRPNLQVSGLAVKGERSESAGHEVPLTGSTETTPSNVGGAETPRPTEGLGIMDRLAVTAEEAAELLGIGRSAVYDLMRSHALPSVKIGRSRRIPVASLKEYVETLTRTSEYV